MHNHRNRNCFKRPARKGLISFSCCCWKFCSFRVRVLNCTPLNVNPIDPALIAPDADSPAPPVDEQPALGSEGDE